MKSDFKKERKDVFDSLFHLVCVQIISAVLILSLIERAFNKFYSLGFLTFLFGIVLLGSY